MSSATETPAQKQLRIKSGVVSRIERELARYHEELAKQSDKIARMVASSADEHDVKKQREVLEETELVIPDTIRRLEKAVEDLREFITANASDDSIAGSAPLTAAQELLARHAADSGLAAPEAEDDAI